MPINYPIATPSGLCMYSWIICGYCTISMVCPHLEYANSVWCPHKLGDIKEIEKVQKRATKLVINLKKIPYTNRLQRLKLPTLKYRRLRGDMIEVFKMTHNIYDPDVSLKLEYNLGCSTRGNKYKLFNCTHGRRQRGGGSCAPALPPQSEFCL